MALDFTTIIPLAVSVGTLTLSWYMTRQKVSYDYAGSLEKRIADLERRLSECERIRTELKKEIEEKDRENLRLLKQLLIDMSKPNVTVNTNDGKGVK